MALQWQWKDKIGEATIRQGFDGEKAEFTKTLYEGNAFLIFINEWDEGEKHMYNLYTFFADERHAKVCLGLTKDSTGDKNNILDSGYTTLTKVRINKAKSRNYKKIVSLFAQAFNNLEIEIFSEDDKND